jgi:UDP-N-acetylglucosamine 3-dehydrogenase
MGLIRVGVVGVGNMGLHHARIYSELASRGMVELVGVADVDYERASAVAKTFNTRAYRDHREILKSVDAVSIATPTETHAGIALDFIHNGICVLVEKPIASTVGEALQLIRESEKSDVHLMVGHVERFNRAVMKLKETVERGSLGDIITFTAKRVGPFAPSLANTSVIVDLAVHDIDVISHLSSSRVERVYARSKIVLGSRSRAEDYGLIMLTYKNGVDAIIETNRLTPYKLRTLECIGTRAVARLDYIEQKLTLYGEEWIMDARIDREEPLKLELLNFIRAVEGAEKPLVKKEDGLYALLVAQASTESSKTGRTIDIEEYAEKMGVHLPISSAFQR